MMVHFVLFKFEDGYMTDALYKYTVDTFNELKGQLPESILEVNVQKNCVIRDVNMDLMVEIALSSEEMLDAYLKHPTHLKYVQKTTPHIKHRCSLDYLK